MSDANLGREQLHGEGGEAGDALGRIQNYDPRTLVRESELGAKFALHDIVEPAERVLSLFKLISPSQIKYFPDQQKNTIRDEANAFYNLLEQCAQFDIEKAQPSPMEAKTDLVN